MRISAWPTVLSLKDYKGGPDIRDANTNNLKKFNILFCMLCF
jgi:hypothetical protein